MVPFWTETGRVLTGSTVLAVCIVPFTSCTTTVTETGGTGELDGEVRRMLKELFDPSVRSVCPFTGAVPFSTVAVQPIPASRAASATRIVTSSFVFPALSTQNGSRAWNGATLPSAVDGP